MGTAVPSPAESESRHDASAPTGSLNQRRILLFWLPLAASWLLMSTEIPYVSAAMARLTEAERMLAAFGIVTGLSITIESPVIMLLATSTALARSAQNYRLLRRFTLHLMLGTTLLHILFGFTPLFDLVVRTMMGVPDSIVEPVRLGMRLMIFWSAAIAWRRFKQGILIRHAQTKAVGQGTAVRLFASAGTATVLALTHRVPGVAVGALGLSAGVIAEAAFAQWAARKLVAEKFGPGAPVSASSAPDISYRELLIFHTPLAASSLLFLLAQPLIAAALSRAPDPEPALAAWPVVASVLFITRAPALALPEVIIALHDETGSLKPLRSFSLRIGAGCVAALALLSFTPLGHFYFRKLIGLTEDLATRALPGAQFGLLLPLVMASNSWYRGLLTSRRATVPITVGMALNLVTMAVSLLAGLALSVPGVPLAAISLTLATGAETGVLWLAARKESIRR